MGFRDNLVNHRMSRDGVQARKSGNQYEINTGGFVHHIWYCRIKLIRPINVRIETLRGKKSGNNHSKLSSS